MNEACRVYLEAMNQFTSDTTMSSEVGVAMSKSNSAMEDVVVKKGKYVDKKNAAEETYKKEIKSEEEDSWNVIEEALQNEDTSILKQYANNTQSSLLNTQIQETQRTSQRTTRSKKTDDLVSSDTDSMQQMQASNKVKKNTNITATTNYLQQTNHVFYRYQLLQHQQRGLSASPKGTPLIVPSKQNSNSRKRNSNAISGSYGGGSVPNFFSKYMKIELDETECRADMLKIVDHMKMNAQSHGNSHQISNHILPNGKMDVAMKANAASIPLVDVMVTENHTLIIQREQYYHVGSHIHITYVVTNETMSNAMITVITPYEIIVKCVIGTRISIPINQIVHNRYVYMMYVYCHVFFFFFLISTFICHHRVVIRHM